jgi:hypothetical protein
LPRRRERRAIFRVPPLAAYQFGLSLGTVKRRVPKKSK